MVTIPDLDNPIDTKETTQAWINAQGIMETPGSMPLFAL